MRSFIAIDFETAQPTRHSPCAIGMVKVVDGVMITQRIYTLIRPTDNVSSHKTIVHVIPSSVFEQMDYVLILPIFSCEYLFSVT